jgi:RND family efflux transporter MFP subunit
MRTTMTKGLAAGVFAALLGFGCSSEANGPSAAGGGGRGGRGGPPMAMPVGMVTLALHPVEQTGEFVGTVRSRRSATIQPQVEGFLTRIHVKSGDRVAQGAPLFEIDASTLQAGIASLESVRAAREADAAFARQQAERARTLLSVGATSQQEFEQAQTQQKTAEAQLKAVEEQIRQQRTELAYHRVTAPTDGVVGDIPVRVGDRVTRSTELTTVQDTGGLELYVNVPVQEAPRLKLGQAVRLTNEAGDVVATERVAFIAPSVDETTQTVLVKTAVSAPRAFRPEQFVRTRIVFESAPGLTIPVTAVTRVSGRQFVFVAEPAEGGLVAKQRAVTLGAVVGNEYVVVDGVKDGERLIVSGIQMIGDGMPVQPAPPAGAPGGAEAGRGRGGQP